MKRGPRQKRRYRPFQGETAFDGEAPTLTGSQQAEVLSLLSIFERCGVMEQSTVEHERNVAIEAGRLE